MVAESVANASIAHQPGPPDPTRHMRLVEWVWEYYSREPVRQPGDGPQTPKLQSSPVFVSGRPPLYFQHQVLRSSRP